MKQGLVSVIVPVYNSERYLDRCVRSIAGQSYTDLEIILVNDGSCDGSGGLCDAWAQKDSRVRVIHKANEGAGLARNSGLEAASGAYICFFDSDDWVAPDAVAKAYALAEKENAQIVVFGAVLEDENGRILGQNVPASRKYVYRGDAVLSQLLPELIDGNHKDSEIRNLTLSLWACMFSGELLRQTGWKIVSEREFASEDSYSLIALYGHVTCVAVLPEALYVYREVADSLSHAYKADTHDRMVAFYRACGELSDRLGYPEKVRRRIAGLFLSQEIGAMKRIVSAELTLREKYRQIRRIVLDDTTQQALSEMNWKYLSGARNILIRVMEKKLPAVTMALVKLQILKGKLGALRKNG